MTRAPALTPWELVRFKRQFLAFTLDLHLTCPVRRCRRRARCLMTDAPCLRRSWGLVEERVAQLVWEDEP